MSRTGKWILHAVLLFGAAVFVIPLLWMMATALKPLDQTTDYPPTWVPYKWVMQDDGKSLVVGLKALPEGARPDTPVTVNVAYQWLTDIDGEQVPVDVPEDQPTGGAAEREVIVNYHLYAEDSGRWLPAKSDDPVAAAHSDVPVSVVVIEPDGYTYRKTAKPDQLRLSYDKTQEDLRTSFGEMLQLSVPTGALVKSPISWINRQELAHVQIETRVAPAGSLSKHVAPQWENFPKATHAMEHFGDYLRNTVTLCVLTVIGTVLSSTLVAYGFSRIDWPGRDKMFLVVMATMMIPFPVVMVPLFTMFKSFGWIGTLKPLWVPTFFAGAFNVFLLRQFFRTLPKDLSDSARIDGCSELRIFWQIIVPLAKPAITVVALFQFMATWNDFLGPLIYLTDQKDFTLALGLQFFQSQHGGTQWSYLMAASALVVLPVIVLFFFAQRTFIEGISMTGLKG